MNGGQHKPDPLDYASPKKPRKLDWSEIVLTLILIVTMIWFVILWGP
jgi:hypothetical protein